MRKIIPYCTPGIDFPVPGRDLTLQDLEVFVGLVVHPFWAFLMMLQLKLCENRNVRLSHVNKSIIVKASTKPIIRHEIDQYSRSPHMVKAINGHEWLAEKTINWWMNRLVQIRGRLVFICLMNDEQIRNVTYTFRGVGVPSSHSCTWYLTALTLFNGCEGLNCVSSWGFFGLFSV